MIHFGCSSDKEGGSSEGGGDGDFVSANPSGPRTRSDDDGAGNGATGAGGTGSLPGAPGEGPDAGEDPGRTIEEADIIKVDGDRLYALSQFGGLSAIDIGTRDQLRLLGRFKTDAMPFEMYLRDNVVLGLFNSYGTYLYDEEAETYTWIQSSRVVALDVSDPANIQELASFNVPGNISDSRIVGDVLYVVGYEETGCWGCGQNPATTHPLARRLEPARGEEGRLAPLRRLRHRVRLDAAQRHRDRRPHVRRRRRVLEPGQPRLDYPPRRYLRPERHARRGRPGRGRGRRSPAAGKWTSTTACCASSASRRIGIDEAAGGPDVEHR